MAPSATPEPAVDDAGALDEAPATPEPVDPTPETEPEPEPIPDDYLVFDGACTEGERVTIAAVGDLLLHRELQRQAFAAKDRYRNIWSNIADLLAEPDLTYGNLEGPMAPGLNRNFEPVEDPGLEYDGVVYSGYPRFNYHPSLAKDLVRAGFDVVSTANNHALDRGPEGVDKTASALRTAGLKYAGTRRSTDPEGRFHTVTNIGPLRVAWVACTKNTNRVEDPGGQVLRCDQSKAVVSQIQRLARSPKVDAVIVTPHWGKEYSPKPRERQIEWAHRWLDAGAIAVIGSHPHVLQPWEHYQTSDGRETFILYSLGNFASHQPQLERRTSLLLYLGLVRDAEGATKITGVRYLPLRVREQDEQYFVEATDRVQETSEERWAVTQMFGESNLVAPDEPKVPDPHCDENWRPAPTPKWVGPAPTPEPDASEEAVQGTAASR